MLLLTRIRRSFSHVFKCCISYIGRGFRCTYNCFITWLTTNAEAITAFAILVAGIWVAGVFIYRHVYIPLTAPLHISPQIELAIGKTREGRIPILMDITIINKSAQKAYILPTVFEARGLEYDEKVQEVDTEEFMKKIDSLWTGWHYEDRFEHEETLVAAGYLHLGSSLMPGESRYASALFYIPAGDYDSIAVYTDFHAVRKKNKIWQKEKFFKKNGYLTTPCRIKTEKPGHCESLHVDRGIRLLSDRSSISKK
ncbi:MAG: hypothetical protein V3V61_01155 [Gammaproteobacteria bacterium]